MCYHPKWPFRSHYTELTCETFDAWTLVEPSFAVVIVQLIIGQLKACVDAAILLWDISIVKVRGGGHGCWRGGREGQKTSEQCGMGLMDDLKRQKRPIHFLFCQPASNCRVKKHWDDSYCRLLHAEDFCTWSSPILLSLNTWIFDILLGQGAKPLQNNQTI